LWLHRDWNELKRQNLCVYLYGMRRKCNVLDQMWEWSSECWNQKHPITIDSSQLISLFNFKIMFRKRERERVEHNLFTLNKDYCERYSNIKQMIHRYNVCGCGCASVCVYVYVYVYMRE
jgi:hypothetical protein